MESLVESNTTQTTTFSKLFDSICHTPVWDTNLSWNTTSPRLTPCFTSTLLKWPQTLFLWLLMPYMVWDYRRSILPTIKWNRFNLTKLMISIFLVLIALVQAIKLSTQNELLKFSASQLYSLWLDAMNYLLVLWLLELQRYHGFINNGIVWFFLFFQTLFHGLELGLQDFSSSDVIYLSMKFAFECLLFILCSFADIRDDYERILFNSEQLTVNETRKKETFNLSPQETVSLPNRLMFWWYWSILWRGFRRPLIIDDIWHMTYTSRTEFLFRKFNQYWNHPRFESQSEYDETRVLKNSEHIKQPNKVNAWSLLVRLHWLEFLGPNVICVLLNLFTLINPLVIKLMINFTDNSHEPLWHGILFSFAFIATNLMKILAVCYQENQMAVLSIRFQSALSGAIYRKSLFLSPESRNKYSTGEIVNLLSVDVERLVDLVNWLPDLISSPFFIVVSFWLLWIELGNAVIGGIFAMFSVLPINFFLMKWARAVDAQQMETMDRRLKIMNEILSGIKVIKLYAWEWAFQKNVEKIRDEEIGLIKKSGYLFTVFVSLMNCLPNIVACLTFGIYVWSNDQNQLTPGKAFTSIAIFNLLSSPISVLPSFFSRLLMTLVSIKRINSFLNVEEMVDYIEPLEEDICDSEIQNNAINIENGFFSWENSGPMTLKDINLNIKKGSLVAVVGSVGSGKSSLFGALLNELHLHRGKVRVNSGLRISYVSQTPWIQNMSIRDNILFDTSFDSMKYEKVIEACALIPDLKILPDGDQTEIGEKGINLSGGQKQRVSLARACYVPSDLILLDDPLSAVDSRVGKHIFERVISSDQGLLRQKTRVLVTNALYVLPYVDKVIVLKNGTIDSLGTYDKLFNENQAFKELIQNYLVNSNQKTTNNKKDCQNEVDENQALDTEALNENQKERNSNKLIEDESVETGNVKFSVYKKYIQSMGLFWFTLIVFCYFSFRLMNLSADFWLSKWTESVDKKKTNHTEKFFLLVYFVFCMGQTLFSVSGWLSVIQGVTRAAKILHEKFLIQILKAPMSFFDTTPSGRIMNRFSRDTDHVDTYMDFIIRNLFKEFFFLLTSIFIISFVTPMFIVFALPFIGIYYLVQRFFIAASRQMQRLESKSKSPFLSHFSETINGVSTIRAFKQSGRFMRDNNHRIDTYQRCRYVSWVSYFWLGIYLQLISNFLIFMSSFLITISRRSSSYYHDIDDEKSSINGSLTGLSLSYAISISGALATVVDFITELEKTMVCVERIRQYSEIDIEDEWVKKDQDKVSSNKWPEFGQVCFDHYSTRYRPGLDLVLNELNFTIRPGEKIGIVGRTGAGKSSLTLALFRLIEAAQGSIKIDQVNLSLLGLHKTRSQISIIPQDPVIFSGTIRYNLDPFDRYTDEQLWSVIKMAHLSSFVLQLDQEVSESGNNLSVGQRQLVCLARALLRNSRVLVLDEATASVDSETDQLVQNTIRSQFADCTVLTIAHRLHTILDSDRVLILEAGRVAEFDSPKLLLEDQASIFYSLAQHAGIV